MDILTPRRITAVLAAAGLSGFGLGAVTDQIGDPGPVPGQVDVGPTAPTPSHPTARPDRDASSTPSPSERDDDRSDDDEDRGSDDGQDDD